MENEKGYNFNIIFKKVSCQLAHKKQRENFYFVCVAAMFVHALFVYFSSLVLHVLSMCVHMSEQ